MSNTKAYGAVFLIRLIYAVMQILMKATFNEGMSTSVFVFYRQSVATLFLVPVAFLLERKRAPPLQYMVALKIFALAFCGISGSINIYNIGLNYTTATSASAMFNIMPVIAFILAVLFRMETVKLNRMHGMVKTSGIVLCLAGVITLALYQGPELKLFTHRYLLHHTGSRTHGASSTHSKKSWVLGVFLMVMSTAAWALWAVLQGPLLLEYPSKLLNTALQCLFSTIQSFFLALIIERDFSRWKIGLDGIIVSGVAHYLQSWTIEKKGPVFLTMSMPLTLVITIILSTILLGEAICLGSVLGGILLVGGLYNVLWGKRMEALHSKIEASNGAEASMEEKEKETQV
ncbi:WAT1-related protein At5g64700 isoform X2 [Ananas comosus]|uniref:WAT1-related protein n=1 Tax=Ananas comosus TaxID=4615 RepID=A0A6P5FKW6_ANACO|nr:WAT1-related protein At5g64700 isoform X2 [Ananas comosus]